MRIGLTVDSLSPQLTGIGRYTWELCQRLMRQEGIADLGLFRFDEWVGDPKPFLLDTRPRRKWLPRVIRKSVARRGFRNRLVHGTNYFLPPHAESGIITVHDMSVFLHPETHPPERVRTFEREFSVSLQRAAHVITDSEATRREMIDHLGVSPDRVTCVYLGVGSHFRPRRDEETRQHVAAILGNRAGDYMLSVATFEPRKRIEAAILAHADMCDRLNWDIPLVLVGARGWNNEALHDLIEREQSYGRLIMPGYVSEQELPYLYAGAKLFVYPSIYEGFGLPPVEAMASGVPTIVADRSCLPEVTRGAAALTDPDDIDRFSRCMEECLLDDNWRESAVKAGRDVAALYTWDRCVAETTAVYRSVSI
jgi:glycosyltransferase involved in cell wall biosynthesis